MKRSFPIDREGASPFSYGDLLRFLWREIRPHQRSFWLATFFRFTSDIAWLYPPYALATIVNLLAAPNESTLHSLITISILWGLAVIWRLTGQYTSKTIGFGVAEKLGLNAKLAATLHLFRLDMLWHERENAGNKLKRIDRGGQAVNQMIRFWFSFILEITVNFIGTIFIVSQVTFGMGVSLIVFLVVFLALSSLLTTRASVMENIVDQGEEDVQGLSFEAVNNIRTVKTLDFSAAIEARLRHAMTTLFTNIKKRIRLFQIRNNALSAWGNAFRLVSFFVIAFGVMRGHYTVGFLVLFHSYFNRIWESVNELSQLAPDVVAAKFAVGRMVSILNEPVIIDTTSGKQPFPREWQSLTVDQLSFAYGASPALHDLSFTIRRGERIGIVGLSGAGKSTLFKLFLKEREDYTGSITFDGVQLRDIEKQSYLHAVAAVLQDTELFNFSLRENIVIVNPDDSEVRLDQTLDVSHVKDFLTKLPQGVETLIGEKGFRLSGGERQRVGIARAIYKQPQILLLDEATSHLDSESERKIQDSLHHVFQSVTAIVIAHRLTTLKELDRILVIERGTLIEQGSFQELLDRGGRFAQLWAQQQRSV